MLTVRRNGSAIEIDITIQVPSVGPRRFTFVDSFDSESYAGFLQQAFSTMIGVHLASERQRWYELGLKDGRAKRKHRDWFPRGWTWPV